MAKNPSQPSYFDILTMAINDVADKGYQAPEQVDYWAEQLRLAAERTLRPMAEVERMVQDAMAAIYQRSITNLGVLKHHPGVSAYTLEMIKPQLRQELSNRVAASIDLIRLNRPAAIEKQQARFRGWATSVPPGGTPKTGKAKLDKVETKDEIRKSLKSLDYNSRRVLIDQGQKLFAAINTTVAVNGGAIGAIWHSHKAQRGYNGRPDHDARDGKVFLVRGSWADQAGLVKAGADGYTDSIEQPAEFVFCKCFYQFLYSLRSLPTNLLTKKGEEALTEARQRIAANAA